MSPRTRKRRLPRTNPIVELVVLVAIALLLALGIQWLLVKPYQIPSGSMLPTLQIGQRVLVDRIGHRLGSDPSIGDVVVFHPPKGANPEKSGLDTEGIGAVAQCGDAGGDNLQAGRPCGKTAGGEWNDENFIKRVVGLPGDRIAVRRGRVIRNGKATKEPFISSSCRSEGSAVGRCNLPKAVTVPKDSYYMMGDNRGDSDDSRYWGPVPRSWVVGGAFATYWPPKRIGTL